MANVFHEIRKFAWLNYFYVWGVLSAVCIVGVFLLTFEHKGVGYSIGVKWIPYSLLVHGGVVILVTGLKGRRYRGCYAWMETWWGKSLLQCIGISFGVLVNEMVAREGVTPYLMLLFSAHAACISRWLHFKVKFELTVTWISTTAILAWSKKPLEGHALWTALIITFALASILVTSNYMEAYRWRTDQIDENGRHSICCNDFDSPWPSPNKGVADRDRHIIAAANAAQYVQAA